MNLPCINIGFCLWLRYNTLRTFEKVNAHMELSHPSYEGDRQQDDEKRRRFNSISPVTKKAVSGWFGSTPVESSSKASTDPEYRMPVSIVAPEVSDQQSRTISHEAALHSNVWLGAQVRLPESTGPISQESAMNQNEAAKPERGQFQRLLERAGLDELARPLEKDAASDRQESPAIANVPEMDNADSVDSTKSREV